MVGIEIKVNAMPWGENRIPRAFFLLILLAFSIQGCASEDSTNPPVAREPTREAAPQTPTITPFQPDPPTPTPGILRVWISPSLPEQLRRSTQGISSVSSRPIEFVRIRDDAEIRVEENASISKSTWIFTLVAPFPSLTDSIEFDDLQSLWNGTSDSQSTLLLSSTTATSLEPLLGKMAESQVMLVEEGLLDTAWNMRDAFAIIPFEELEPKWKVVAVDERSPLEKFFDPDSYALALRYGVSGEGLITEAFSESLEWPNSNRDPQKLTFVVMTGVTALTRATAWTMENKGIEYPAEKIGSWLNEADVTHISNEVSFLETCPAPSPVREGFKFCSAPEYVALLEFIGTDVVELTGNHIKDYGDEALLYSLNLYHQLGWQYFGGGEDLEDASRPARFEHNGNRIAFLGCNSAGPPSVWAKESTPGALPCELEVLIPLIRELRSEGYLPIFTFQWIEYYQPKPSTKQKEDFRAVAEAGAVIVSGSQAHQPQAFEFFGDGLIHYGLGNLFFDQMWSIAVRQEFIDRHVFYDGKYINTEVLTAFLEDFAQPRPMTTEERNYFLGEIFSASEW